MKEQCIVQLSIEMPMIECNMPQDAGHAFFRSAMTRASEFASAF